MKKIVVLTGAGISAESGIKTFRDQNGLWKNYRMEEVASPTAWARDPELVLGFYNIRRKQLFEVEPNAAHFALVKLETKYDVQIITQNVDDLHERAGSKNVIHLHGELKKVRSTADPSLVYEMDDWELKLGDTCEKGSQLRPHIVWFGEQVPNISIAAEISSTADIYLIIGTSLLIYPAAGLVQYAPAGIPVFYVDPKASGLQASKGIHCVAKKAVEAIPGLVENLLNNN